MMKNDEELMRLVCSAPESFSKIPTEHMTEAMCFAAVQRAGRLLKHVPVQFRSAEMCVTAMRGVSVLDVKKLASEHIWPHEHLINDPMVWMTAVTLDPSMIAQMPEHLCTLEFRIQAIKAMPAVAVHLLGRFMSKELWDLAVCTNGMMIDILPPGLLTPERCLMAVMQNGLALECVPEHLRTTPLIKTAVAQNGKAIRFVAKEFRTAELYAISVKQNGRMLEAVPDELKTQAMCIDAVHSRGYALAWMPTEWITQELCDIAAQVPRVADPLHDADNEDDFYSCDDERFGDRVLPHIPSQFRTYDVCLAAVSQCGMALAFVPKPLMTKAMCMAGVRNNPRSINDILDTHPDYTELYRAAIEIDPSITSTY